jgi:hypothetical protein
VHNSKKPDFFEFWESFGIFDNLRIILPSEFHILFEIARNIFTGDVSSDVNKAIEDISREETAYKSTREEDIEVNRLDRTAPLSDRMEIDKFRKITELKKALPRELAQDDDIFEIKLFTRSLLIQKFYETDTDTFKPISTSRDEYGKDANRFEQKFYILLDCSRSMEQKLRSFYSKYIVAEFLRRKFKSRAKLYYRPFDTTTGELFKVEKTEDFPKLVENIMLTETGGTSTNIQRAVFQAVDDIQYDKEMLNAEILVVTDGISRIDRYDMKKKLGDIKLNVLKIGDEFVSAGYFELKAELEKAGIDVDMGEINLRSVKDVVNAIDNDSFGTGSPASGIPPVSQHKAYRFISTFMEGVFDELREVAHKFVEIPDIKEDLLFKLTDEHFENLSELIERIKIGSEWELDLNSRKRLYKQAYSLAQYIRLLIDHQDEDNPRLYRLLHNLSEIRERMLRNSELLFEVVRAGGFKDDEQNIYANQRQMQFNLKNVEMKNNRLTANQIKKAKLLLKMDVSGGERSPGMLLYILIIKLMQFLKKIILAPFGKPGEKEPGD